MGIFSRSKEYVPGRKLIFFRVIFFLSFVGLLLAGLFFFERHYKKQLWNPDVVALVNGRPIGSQDLEQLLEIGFHPSLIKGQPSEGSITLNQILDRLIEEELLVQAAEEAGVVVTDAEKEIFFDQFRKSWDCKGVKADLVRCQLPRGQEMENFKKAVGRQLILDYMSRRVINEKGRKTGQEWQVFWNDWIKNYTLSSVYTVRVLLSQNSEEVKKIMVAHFKAAKGSLEDLEKTLSEAGLASIITRSMSINPLDSETRKLFDLPDLAEELSKALERPRHLSPPLRLPESYALFEVLDYYPPLSPEEFVIAAKNTFERQVGDRTFRLWLDELRAAAKIEINPNIVLPNERGEE